ncbi:MAG: DUF3800 domain-containing protein, partial [Desulfatibacillum sp.]|nr:DUF3800 domain-containing protein [Desulfatibacillum sp.]
EQRIRIILKVLDVLKETYKDTTAFACAVHKNSFTGKDLYMLAFEDLVSRFDMYLNRIFHDKSKGQHKGMIIFDENDYQKKLQKQALVFRQHGTQWRHLRDIIEVPFFVDSRASRLVQLADHVSYAVFRYYNANDMNYFNCITSKFDSQDGVMHGLVHKQTHIQECWCPACLTRRMAHGEKGGHYHD